MSIQSYNHLPTTPINPLQRPKKNQAQQTASQKIDAVVHKSLIGKTFDFLGDWCGGGTPLTIEEAEFMMSQNWSALGNAAANFIPH